MLITDGILIITVKHLKLLIQIAQNAIILLAALAGKKIAGWKKKMKVVQE